MTRPPHCARFWLLLAFHHRISMVLANDRSERSVATHCIDLNFLIQEEAAALCVLD
jgi:hypothetical protein